MAEQLLGLEFDIHGGGADLIFPHHENEAAQTAAARDRPLARLWVHNGMVELDDEKMSKSLGNIRSLAGALDHAGREALVLYLLSGHYRQPLAYSEELLEEARRRAERIRDAARRLVPGPTPADMALLRERFLDALADDFNTPEALAALADWVREANRREEAVGDADLRDMLGILGLESLLEAGAEGPGAEIQALAEEREEARRARDFARADALRDELRARGWQVRDGPDGPELLPAA
jgi:cysteinyl-tRNA synthetase